MKITRTHALTLLVLCFVTTLLAAQTEVTFDVKSMSLGPFDCLTTSVTGADEKLAHKEWRDLMKEYRGKCKRSKPEKFKTEGITIDGIGGADVLNVYAMFEQQGSSLKTTVWLSERGDFLNPSSSARDVTRFKALVTEYSEKLCISSIKEDLEAEQKTLKKVKKDLDQIESAHIGYLKDIEDAKKAIETAEKRIIENEKKKQETLVELEVAEEAVKAVELHLAGGRCDPLPKED